MYLLPVEIKESKVHGKGVFALVKISKGQIVWKFDVSHDKVMSVTEFGALDSDHQSELKRVAYLSPTSNRYVYPPENDPARFTNHSSNNSLSVLIDQKISEEPCFIANRDIQSGEELTNNYTEFDESIKTFKPEWIQ